MEFDSEGGWDPFDRLFEAFARLNVRLTVEAGARVATFDCEVQDACVDDDTHGVRVRPLDVDDVPTAELRFVAYETIRKVVVY